MNDKIKINLNIADSNYPLRIDRQEEEVVRKAATKVNERLNAYRSHYPQLESERILAMVAYELSLENLKMKDRNDTRPFVNTIEKLTKEIEGYFSQE
ncbi:MAG: cell division protein ZapA [Bacteroides sp.]|nr:cell division protein ZapA [Bacteroides sp.]